MAKMATLAHLYDWRELVADSIRGWQPGDGQAVLDEMHREYDAVCEQINELKEWAA